MTIKYKAQFISIAGGYEWVPTFGQALEQATCSGEDCKILRSENGGESIVVGKTNKSGDYTVVRTWNADQIRASRPCDNCGYLVAEVFTTPRMRGAEFCSRDCLNDALFYGLTNSVAD